MKRLLSLLLLLSMLIGMTSFLFACKSPETTDGGGGTPDVSYLDSLDSYGDSLDFSAQEEFVISFAEQFQHEVYGEENSNEKLDTLVYNRNRLLERRFGIKIATDGGVADTAGVGHYNYVQLCLNSGDVTFDAVAMNAYQAGKLILGNGGNFLDFRSEIPYCRDSILACKEWWPKDINIDSTVMGRQFVAVSDFSLSAMEMCFAVIFNKDLARASNVAQSVDPAKYNVESTLYDLVRGNDWTLEIMKSIVKDYWYDNPNTGKRGERDAEDRFGLLAPVWTDVDAFAYSFGYNYIINDGASRPELWTWDGSQFDAIESLRELYYSNGVWTDEGNRHLGIRAKFFAQENHVLFQLNTLGSLKYEEIHTMEQDFGVLPYPKYDRDQAKYLTGSLDNYSAMAVPFTSLWNMERLRMTGALIEALAAETCNSVKKPYYDEIITHHNVVDGDSAEMINIIMAGRVYDLGVYHHNELMMDEEEPDVGSFALFFRYLLRYKNKDIVQYWQSNREVLIGRLDSLLQRYELIP